VYGRIVHLKSCVIAVKQHLDRGIHLHPSILSALQPWVSLGLLNNQSPLLSIFCLLHPLLYLRYSQVCYNIVHHLRRGLLFLLPMNNLPSIIFLGIVPTPILLTCPSHLILWLFINFTIPSPFITLLWDSPGYLVCPLSHWQ
jgi:hypothetical protein